MHKAFPLEKLHFQSLLNSDNQVTESERKTTQCAYSLEILSQKDIHSSEDSNEQTIHF